MASKRFIGFHNLGFMQGRLLDSPYNKIQCFPQKKWTEEFDLAKKNNFLILEWTVNSINLKKNPLFNGEIKKINYYKKKFNISIPSITCDYFMEKAFFKYKANSRKKIINNIFKLIKNSEKIKAKYFVIPLVDNSSIKNDLQEKMLIKLVKKILKKFKKIKILFETDYYPLKVLQFIKKFNSFRVGINYDSGNSASLGYNFEDEKIYFNYVKNFHIKDRKFNSKTVRLGKGDAKLKKILNYMKKIKYKNNFILQTARSKSKEHIKEININRNYVFNLNI